MRSKYGDVFERETIERWLADHGPACPLSGRPLGRGDLFPYASKVGRGMGGRMRARKTVRGYICVFRVRVCVRVCARARVWK